MKAEEIRSNLINGLNQELAQNATTATYGKPKMFESSTSPKSSTTETKSFKLSPIRGLGFRDEVVTPQPEKPYEIYSMKELIASHPESMRTLSIEPEVMKERLALVKKKEWQDILFGDIDWLKPIDLTSGFKKMFKF